MEVMLEGEADKMEISNEDVSEGKIPAMRVCPA